MRLFSNFVLSVILISFSFSLFYCGGNSAEEAEKAFQSGNYKMAIQLFGKAREQDPNNQMYNEKIALSFMHRGLDFFKKTNNIKAFAGNFEKSSEYIPESPSPEFKISYSAMLFKLGEAYIKSKPQNDIQREEFLNNSLTNLEEALFLDENNTSADSLMAKIKVDNFQKMLDKGKDLYTKARKQKNYDMYFSAEYYFKKAAYFDVHNEEVKDLLSATRKRTLPVLNYRDDIALAIAETKRNKNKLILDIRVKNYLTDPIEVNIENFKIFDLEGNTYPIDKAWMEKNLGKSSLKNTKLDQKKTFVDGIIVLSVPKNIKPDYLSYKVSDSKESKKYFP